MFFNNLEEFACSILTALYETNVDVKLLEDGIICLIVTTDCTFNKLEIAINSKFKMFT